VVAVTTAVEVATAVAVAVAEVGVEGVDSALPEGVTGTNVVPLIASWVPIGVAITVAVALDSFSSAVEAPGAVLAVVSVSVVVPVVAAPSIAA
jgi:hypothetical protein